MVGIFLAHLNLQAHSWAYSIGRLRCPSVVVHTLYTSSPQKLLDQSKSNFIWSLHWGTKVCSNGPGHMTKMAAMLLYGKNHKKSSSPEPKGRWPWKLVFCIRCSSTTKFVQMKTLSWPWLVLGQGQIWSLMLLYGKKVKQWIFQKLLWSMMSKLVDAVN